MESEVERASNLNARELDSDGLALKVLHHLYASTPDGARRGMDLLHCANSTVNRNQVRGGAAVMGWLLPSFIDIIMEDPARDRGRPFYPVVD